MRKFYKVVEELKRKKKLNYDYSKTFLNEIKLTAVLHRTSVEMKVISQDSLRQVDAVNNKAEPFLLKIQSAYQLHI